MCVAGGWAGMETGRGCPRLPPYPSPPLSDPNKQPITLFENILLEIDRGYVEPVDDKRLFEAGVKAMLDTLDPYTEFEGEELAKVFFKE